MENVNPVTIASVLAAAVAALFAWLMKSQANHLKDVVAEKDKQLAGAEAVRAREGVQYEERITAVRRERDKLLASIEAMMGASKPVPAPPAQRVARAEQFVEHVTKELSLSPDVVAAMLKQFSDRQAAS